jgi:DNA-binding MarR family transcriptional regulator
MGWDDINPVQALLMFNIGGAEMTAGELRSRGYYLGSNVSYNLKKLVETGYIFQERSRADRRSVRIRLTPKGEEVAEVIDELYDRHLKSIDKVGGLDDTAFEGLNKALGRLERFWVDQILYKLKGWGPSRPASRKWASAECGIPCRSPGAARRKMDSGLQGAGVAGAGRPIFPPSSRVLSFGHTGARPTRHSAPFLICAAKSWRRFFRA